MAEEQLQLVVEQAHDGLRLDRYVAETVTDLSRTYARQLIEDAHIRLNGRDARPSSPVRIGDSVSVQLPVARPTDLVAQDIPLTVVYEDADIAVIDKPAGLVVHPAPGHRGPTLVDALGDLLGGGEPGRPGIVQRLDRDTSGLMVVARDAEAHRRLAAMPNSTTAVWLGRYLSAGSRVRLPIRKTLLKEAMGSSL